MSQDAFARSLGFSKTSVQNWESGRKQASPASLRHMARIFPVMAAELEQAAVEAEESPRRDRRMIRRRMIAGIDVILKFATDDMVAAVGDYIEERASRFSYMRELKEDPKKIKPKTPPVAKRPPKDV